MRLLRSTLILLAMLLYNPAGVAADSSCSQFRPLPVRIQMAEHTRRQALLIGSADAGLRLVDAIDGTELWSAGTGAGATQNFAQMNAAFGSSLTAIDLDGDGLHDRLYAGDRAGNLWRFDLHAAAPAAHWASGGIFASLGGSGIARGFIAAPDVALIAEGNVAPWLSIAIGSATVGEGLAANRFYVLRDPLAPGRLTDSNNPAPTPLHEIDLQRLQVPLGTRDLTGPGYYVALGTSQVLAPSLTLGGRIHFMVAETSRLLTGGCPDDAPASNPSIASVSIIRAEDGAVIADLNDDGRIDNGDLRRSLPHSLPANVGIELTVTSTGEAGSRLECSIGALRLDGCGLDTTPQRTYWRREDSD